jgi:uncharacterized protein (TIGR03435 family)
MKKLILGIVTFAMLLGVSLRAQDITGAWQGTLTPASGKELRIVLKIAKDDGKLQATMYSIDQGARPFKASSVSLDGSTFKCASDVIGISYEGKLSADGKSITGNWTQGPTPQPLNLVRATKETAWEIPARPSPPKLMAADANPSFDVATIKPNDSGATNMQGLNFRGRNFTTRASSVGDLIAFAYDVQIKQIVNAPDWLDKDRYDISAVPDQEGMPNPKQLKIMIQKLLADRFQLKFHHDKKEMSAFALTVSKEGQKLKPTQLPGPAPGFGLRPAPGGLTIPVINTTMSEFANFLQMLVLDRPVVDQTGIAGNFDFALTFAPDDSVFNGHPPIPKSPDDTTTQPPFFEAIQEQAGLKLEAKKTLVDVIAIDHIEKPSAN